jgi:hypothetical protein
MSLRCRRPAARDVPDRDSARTSSEEPTSEARMGGSNGQSERAQQAGTYVQHRVLFWSARGLLPAQTQLSQKTRQ